MPPTAAAVAESVAAIAATGIGGLTLLAVFGTPGMLLVTLVFIGMTVPTASATTPIQALPGFYRFLAEVEPLRQITGGVRSILHYGAQGDAGLARGRVMTAVGLIAAALFGFGVTGWYDHRGPHRVPAETKPEKTAAPEWRNVLTCPLGRGRRRRSPRQAL